MNVWEVVIVLVVVLVVLCVARVAEFRRRRTRAAQNVRMPTRNETSPPAASVPSVQVAVEVTQDVGENKCPSCNTVNPTGQVFCGQCGIRLTRAA